MIDNVSVSQVKETKFLGVIINESLSWTSHVSTIQQKVTKNLGIIRHMRNIVPLCVLKMLYLTLIQPYFEYCNVVWSIHKSTSFAELLICQKKSIRVITNSKWNAHTQSLFYKTRILPLDKLNDFHVACFMYRSVHSMLPKYLCSMFVENAEIHSHNTKKKADLHHFTHRLNLRKHTIRIHSPIIWNTLSLDMRNVPFFHVFERKYRDLLFSSLSP